MASHPVQDAFERMALPCWALEVLCRAARFSTTEHSTFIHHLDSHLWFAGSTLRPCWRFGGGEATLNAYSASVLCVRPNNRSHNQGSASPMSARMVSC